MSEEGQATRRDWTREELVLALTLYCQLPFGKLHQGNPRIKEYAGWIGRTPSALAMKLSNLASMDPAITDTGRKGLESASKSDRAMWNEMQADWQGFAVESDRVLKVLRPDNGEGDQLAAKGTQAAKGEVVPGEVVDQEVEDSDYSGASKWTLTQTRIGQSFFRSAVLSAYQGRCCMSGLAVPELLTASHIIPWSQDPSQRLNPRNGLCLSALHDRAFDRGLISLSDDYRVLVSSDLKVAAGSSEKLARAGLKVGMLDLRAALLDLEGAAVELPGKFQPNQEFLAMHRTQIFRG